MHAAISGSGKYKHVYVMESYRNDQGKVSKRTYRDLGRLEDLLERFNGDKEVMMEWARSEALKDTQKLQEAQGPISLEFNSTELIDKDTDRIFNVGYLFLQSICYQLKLHTICRSIMAKHRAKFDLAAILMDLIFARVLEPASKLSSFHFCESLLEPPTYHLEHVYRALSILASESDHIQAEVYRNSQLVHPRNTTVLYYDCTNYFFEIEQEDSFRKYGKSKEHRPNPITTMGLFMDADGIPLAFDMFPGNQSEQTTLKPLETKIIRDFDCSEFIFCSDAGLGSASNRVFNSLGNRKYVIAHSLKRIKKELRETALNPKFFKAAGSDTFIDISTLDETDPAIFNSTFYKEVPVDTDGREETLVVTYSPKYKAYQSTIRANQVQRAQTLIASGDTHRPSKNPNSPSRFISKTALTKDGEIAERTVENLNESRILEEARYDGFYAVITNINDDPEKIMRINKQRWQIEDNFRIMKHEFSARPVHVQREDRIRAHFLTCFLALLVYRLLEKKLDNQFTCHTIITTLQDMKLFYIPEKPAYMPAYKRTDVTDALHDAFGYRTDYKAMSKQTVRHLKKVSKEEK